MSLKTFFFLSHHLQSLLIFTFNHATMTFKEFLHLSGGRKKKSNILKDTGTFLSQGLEILIFNERTAGEKKPKCYSHQRKPQLYFSWWCWMWNGLQCLSCISNAGSALTGWLNTPFWLHKPFIPHLALSMHLCQVWNPFYSPHFIGTAHKIMFWSGKWLQTCLEGQAETQRKIWVFSSLLCSGTWTPKEALGILRDHSSQICCNLHWKFRGKISKIENLSLYFAAYTGDEQFWVSGNILLMAGQEKNPVKVKNPVKRSATPHWGAVYPERTGVSPCHPELPHTPMWLWEGTPVKFLEFLQWVGALVFLQATYKWEKRSSEAKWNQSFTTEAC